MTTRRASVRPHTSVRNLLGQCYESGTKAPVSGYYAYEGNAVYYRKTRILPEVNNEQVVYRLVQISREAQKLGREATRRIQQSSETVAEKPKGLLKKFDEAIGNHPNIRDTVVDLLKGRSSSNS